MPNAERRGRIARVRLVPPDQGEMFRGYRERVIAAFVPGTAAERYGRTWLMGQTQVDGEVLSGRIGFESDGGQTEVWDEKTKDFRTVEYPTGTTSPFAVRLTDLVVAFQTRGSVIKVSSFVGAMQALIREATGEREWQVVSSRNRESIEQWRRSVDRVTRVRFRVERPNPNYQGRPFVENFIEGSGAAAANVNLQNPNGLDVDSEIVSELIDHVQRGYGNGTLTGQRGGDTSTYETNLQGESELEDAPVDERGDVPTEELGAALMRDADGGDHDDDS